jgi:hypothetical protein
VIAEHLRGASPDDIAPEGTTRQARSRLLAVVDREPERAEEEAFVGDAPRSRRTDGDHIVHARLLRRCHVPHLLLELWLATYEPSSADLRATPGCPAPSGPLSQSRGDGGYDRMDIARGRGWDRVPSWGLDDWDLGARSLFVISHRHTRDRFDLGYDVEGDITVYRYPTRELRDAATDCLAF